MNSVLITGTDTGVGKTVVCGCLAAYLRDLGLNVITQKWVQTGCGSSDDVELHSITPLDSDYTADDLADLRMPYRLKHPASPHLAAELEGVQIDVAKIEFAHAKLTQHFDLVVVEGSGGALVPITKTILMADVAVRLNLPVVIVAENKLGCINHALLTVEALRARGLRVVGLIFNRIGNEWDETILTDNIRAIARLAGVPVLGEMPGMDERQYAAELFRPIGEAFYREWRSIADE